MNQNQTIAYIFGQPVTDVPSDLFIPPAALQVILHSFEGPLDLLLYLIRKQNIDILDIPMVKITEQYLNYISQIDSQQFDLASEYLLMAAMLIQIKSRLLLPAAEPPDDEEDDLDPRAELVRRLLIYEQMKLAAQDLDTLPRAGREFAWAYLPLEQPTTKRQPEVDLVDLKQAWFNILSRSAHTKSHQIKQEAISVRECMSAILRHLDQHHGEAMFSQLFKQKQGITYLVVTFIALLELAKEGLVYLQQASQFDEIMVLIQQPSKTSTSEPIKQHEVQT